MFEEKTEETHVILHYNIMGERVEVFLTVIIGS